MDFKAAWHVVKRNEGYLLMLAYFAFAAHWWSKGQPAWLVVGNIVLGLLFAFLFQCPKGLFYKGRKVGVTVTVETFEQGELDVLNKGHEPVETPHDPVGDIIASHDSSCEICTEWKRLREQSG